MFTEEEIAIAWESRKRRQLKIMYRDRPREYLMLLKVFKSRNMTTQPIDRREYLNQWRQDNKDKIRSWNRKYQLERTKERQQKRFKDILKHVSKEELLIELQKREERK